MNALLERIEAEWVGILQELQKKVPKPDFEMYLLPLEPEVGDDDQLRLVVPFAAFRDAVQERYGPLIRKIANKSIPARIGSSGDSGTAGGRPWRRRFEMSAGSGPEPLQKCSTRVQREERSKPMAANGVTVHHILDVVEEVLGVSRKELKSSGRARSIVAARDSVAYIARRLTTLSSLKLGKSLGGLNHSTILRAVKRTKERTDADETFAEKVRTMEQRVLERLREAA
jgi:chromosomal replication initiation ATPase DnaA